MVFLMAGYKFRQGSYVLQEQWGQHFAEFSQQIEEEAEPQKTHIKILTTNYPFAYFSCMPWYFMNSEQEFRDKVLELKRQILETGCAEIE